MNILERIDNALAHLTEDEMFGQARPGRTYEDLKWVAGPLSENPRKVALNDKGQRVDAGPAERWTMEEVWAALAPMIKSIARQYSGSEWSRGSGINRDTYNDLIQNSAVAIIRALQRGDDESRIGNQFSSWIRRWVHSAVRGGVGVDADLRRASNLLRNLASASAKNIDKYLGQLPAQAKNPDAPELNDYKINKYGESAPMLYAFASKLKEAIATGNKKAEAAIKQEIKDKREEIRAGYTSFGGAATGAHVGDVVKVAHSGAMRDEFRSKHKVTGMEVNDDEGGTTENPHMPFSPDQTKEVANQEVIKKLLKYVRYGYKGPEGTVAPIDNRKYQILIRKYGVADYPGRGDPVEDPEFSVENYKKLKSEYHKTGKVVVAPVSANEATTIAEIVGMDQSEAQSLAAAAAEGQAQPVTLQPNPGQAQKLIHYLTYSPWVRAGCPPLDDHEINNGPLGLNMNVSTVRMSQIMSTIGKPTGPTGGKNPKVGVLRQLGDMLKGKVGMTQESKDDLLDGLLALYECAVAFRSAVIEEATDSEFAMISGTALSIRRTFYRSLTA